jgi:hypothetical protein
MSGAAVDRALAILIVAMAATGLLSLRAGDPGKGWVFVAHDLLAGALTLAVAIKLAQSVPRAVGRRRVVRLAFGLGVALVAVAALTGGYLWVASGEIVWLDVGTAGRWTVLTLHAWAGLVLVPLVVVHVLPKRWRLLRPIRSRATTNTSRPISRRDLLVGGAFGVAGLSLWATTNAVELLAGGRRRFTGSRLLAPGSMPIATTFLGEPTPAIDAASWQLTVDGAVARPLTFDLAALRVLGDREIRAVLDCTSGWAVDTTWRGVPLAGVLEAAGTSSGARRVDIMSVTGWATSIDVADTRDGLLAWSVGGQPLPVANGAPIRLVLPNRRGLDWVKWVGAIRIE